MALAREILVYPPVETTDEFFEIIPMITGEFESFARGRGDDLYLIREYMPEDSARHVDWKATAKSGSLKVREFSREDERKLRIVFDNPGPGNVSEQAYENAVTAAASLSWHFAEANAELSFVAQDYQGGAEVYDFLEYLATVAPQTGSSVLDHLEISGDYNIILTTRPRGIDSRESLGLLVLYFLRDWELMRRLPAICVQPESGWLHPKKSATSPGRRNFNEVKRT